MTESHERTKDFPDSGEVVEGGEGDVSSLEHESTSSQGEGLEDHGSPSLETGEEGDDVDGLRQEFQELNDRHLRLAAEFDNFRRRSHAQLGESGTRAQASLVSGLLDVLDDFHRVAHLEPHETNVESLLEGVRLVEQKFNRALEEVGLEEIEAQGSVFDPNSMEAMMKEPAESEEEDETVSRVLQKGFRFKGHLIRPARVSVRKYE
jgi:molecular chaperone GrpE